MMNDLEHPAITRVIATGEFEERYPVRRKYYDGEEIKWQKKKRLLQKIDA